MILHLIVTLVVASGPRAHAQAAAGNGSSVAIPTTTTSINPGANQGKKSQDSGQAANMAMAAAMAAMAMMTQPPNMGMLMMAAMAAMQGGADGDAADQSAMTAAATSNNPTNSSTTTTPPNYAAAAAGTASFDDQKKTIAAGMKALNDAGYTASPAGITSSSGTIPASAFNSSSSMLAAGIDPAAVKAAEKVGKDIGEKYGTISVGTEDGGGGGGPPSALADSSSGESTYHSTYKNPFLLAPEKKAELTAGKTVTLDGEPIGVKGDDIFQMVHLAYARKRAGNHFIETDHDPSLGAAVQVRAPASLGTLAPRVAPAAVPPVRK